MKILTGKVLLSSYLQRIYHIGRESFSHCDILKVKPSSHNLCIPSWITIFTVLLKASTKYFVREYPESWRKCQIAAEINKYKGGTEVKVFKRVEITTVVIDYDDNNKCFRDREKQNSSV